MNTNLSPGILPAAAAAARILPVRARAAAPAGRAKAAFVFERLLQCGRSESDLPAKKSSNTTATVASRFWKGGTSASICAEGFRIIPCDHSRQARLFAQRSKRVGRRDLLAPQNAPHAVNIKVRIHRAEYR